MTRFLKKLQVRHAENMLKLYEKLGGALTSEFAYATGKSLNDPRFKAAIRKMVADTEPLPYTKANFLRAGEAFEEYMKVWIEVFQEYQLEWQAWHAEPIEEAEQNVKQEPVAFWVDLQEAGIPQPVPVREV